MMTPTLETPTQVAPSTALPAPMPYLPDAPTVLQLEAYAKALSAQTPDREINEHWLVNTLQALPLPAPPAPPPPYQYPTCRHAKLITRTVKMQDMAAQLSRDIQDARYWGDGEVRNAMKTASAALSFLLEALERRSWTDGDVLIPAEEQAIEMLYARAKNRHQ